LRSFKGIFGAAFALTATVGVMAQTTEPTPDAEPSLVQAITGGKLILDLQPRMELVDQTGFAKEAEAYTVRTQLGWETASWHDLKALLDFEDVSAIGGQGLVSSKFTAG